MASEEEMRALLKEAGEALDALISGDPPASHDWRLAEDVLEKIEAGGYVTVREF